MYAAFAMSEAQCMPIYEVFAFSKPRLLAMCKLLAVAKVSYSYTDVIICSADVCLNYIKRSQPSNMQTNVSSLLLTL
eukprot:14020647-Heterocapsa_arctica.AAC.1